MRIAIDGSSWGYSRGFGRYTRALTRALLRVAPERDLTLVVDRFAALRDDLPDMPRVVVTGGRPAGDLAAATEGRTPGEVWRKARALSRFDTIVFPTHTEFVPVSPRARVGLIVHDAILDADPDAWLASRGAAIRWRAKTWLALRQAAVLATPTEASARAIREQLPVGDRPIVVLGAGADPVFSALETAEDAPRVGAWVPPNGRYLLYVGAFGPHKRVPDLVRAFGVLAGMPDCADVRLVLVGESEGWDPERAAVERALKELGPLGSRVVRTRYLDDATLAALYRGAACVVLPATIEGFGLPALEAMASGTSVVASRIPALEEVCGEAAEYFTDPVLDLPGVLARLLGDPERRAALSRRGIARAAAFGWDGAAGRLLDALCDP